MPILARLAFEPRLADSTDRGVLFVREYASTPTGKVLADIAGHVDAIVAARTRAVDTHSQLSLNRYRNLRSRRTAVSTESATREYSNIPAPRCAPVRKLANPSDV